MTDPKTMAVPMPILTPRLRLEIISPKYLTEHLESLTESKTELAAFFPWIHKPDALDMDVRRKWLRNAARNFKNRKELYMLAFERDTGKLVSGTGFHDINWDIPSFDIGYWVRTSCAGRGYATEITQALMKYAFLALKAKRVTIYCDVNNVASKRVIEKSGFQFECLAKNAALDAHGKVTSTYRYAITDPADVPDIEISWGHK